MDNESHNQAQPEEQPRDNKYSRTLLALTSSQTVFRGDLQATLQQVTETATDTLGAARANVWAFREGGSKIRCLDHFDAQEHAHSAGDELLCSDYPNYFRELQNARMICTDDASQDPRTAEFTDEYLVPNGITSMLDAPLRVEGAVTGVLCVEHTGPPRRWSVDDQNFVASLADLVMLALEARERHKAEKTLRATIDGLRAVARAATELIGCPDPDTFYRRAVELAREQLGVERCSVYVRDGEEVRGTYGTNLQGRTVPEHAIRHTAGERWTQRRPPKEDQTPRWTSKVEPLLEYRDGKLEEVGKGWVVETPIQGSTGETIGILFNDTAISGAEIDEVRQEVLAVYCSHLGTIMDRFKSEQLAEEAVRESELRTRLVIDNALDAVITIDTKGLVIGWNPQATTLFQWTPDEALGTRLADLIIPLHLRDRHLEGLNTFAQTGLGPMINRLIETTAVRRDGHEFPIELSVVPLRVGAETIFSAFVRDITERTKQQQELRRVRDQLEQRVGERTEELRKLVNAMAGREVRMAELKDVIRRLQAQLRDADLVPVAGDPATGEAGAPDPGSERPPREHP